jgi:hypothetical protein
MPVKSLPVRSLNLVLFSILYFLRRPADALYPSVWSEDGILNIPQALADGWSSLLTPVAGYLIIPSKLVTLSSLNLSGLFYPEIAYFLTFLITLSVLVAITSKYVAISGKEYLPLVIALLPYDPEVFATPLYTFWWVTLLLIIPIFSADLKTYQSQTKLFIATLTSIFLACLSSPLCVLLWPVMVLRTFITRSRLDYLATALWSLLAAIQFSLVSNHANNDQGYSTDFAALKLSIPRYFGNFFYYDGFLSNDELIVYLVFAAFLGLAIWAILKAHRSRNLEAFYMTAAFLMASISVLSSTLRVVLITDPFTAGPRYFFFPYIFLAIFFLSVSNYFKKAAVRGFIIALLISTCCLTWIDDPQLFYRVHDHISWRQQLQACAGSQSSYRFKVQGNGSYDAAWEYEYAPAECQQIINSGLLTRIYNWQTLPMERLPD